MAILNANSQYQSMQRMRTIVSGSECQKSPPSSLNNGDYTFKGHNNLTFSITQAMLATGLLIDGSTGCGKTTLLRNLLRQVIPDMTKEDIMIIFDAKGDFRDLFYDPNNQNHILVSLSQNDQKIAAKWNFFRELTDENGCLSTEYIDVTSSEFSKYLFKGLESSNQPFFTTAAADITAKLMASFVRSAIETKDTSLLTNKAFTEFLSRADNQKILSFTQQYSEYAYLSSYVGNGTSQQALGVYGLLMTMIQRNFFGSFNKSSLGNDFGIKDFIRNKGGKILFLEYDVRYSETLSVVYSLLFDFAIKEALSCKGGNKWFVCDEASLIPYIQNMQELLNRGRSAGCKTIFAIQTYSQLKKNYGEDEANSISAGFCNMISFQSSDHANRTYVKQRCGEVLEAYNYGAQNITHDSYTIRDSDLRDLLPGEAVIDIKNAPVFRFHFKE